MISLATFGLFLVAVFALFLSPGPNMAFVLSHGMAYGMRGGFAAAIGITLADLVLTLLTATGITALVAAWPPSFDLLRYAGALYLVWLAIQAIRSPGVVRLKGREATSFIQISRMAMLNSLLNPKALLFFMVFLPQFVDASRGNIALQLAMLGVTLSIAALVFNSALGACGGRVGTFLNRHPQAVKWQGWLLSTMLFGLAARLLVMERPALR
jgi:threonine/homoserine/homoserine lactone efflux protein